MSTQKHVQMIWCCTGTTGLSACQVCLRGTRGFFPQRRGCKLRDMAAADRLEAGLLPHLSEANPPPLIDASYPRRFGGPVIPGTKCVGGMVMECKDNGRVAQK